jgi:hypothetical protein
MNLRSENALAAGYMLSIYILPWNFLIKFAYKCLMHSRFSQLGNTRLMDVSNPLHASLEITSPCGEPIARCNRFMNHSQLSLVSE